MVSEYYIVSIGDRNISILRDVTQAVFFFTNGKVEMTYCLVPCGTLYTF